MEKPRILIADTDVNYALTMQQCFAEHYLGQVDLEVITSAEYFAGLFTVLQRVDILLVSESLYMDALHRHSIAQIFLMKEHDESDQTERMDVVSIFKYSSLQSILKVVRSRLGRILPDSRQRPAAAQIILVTSACGGVGKTTLAMGMSTRLAGNKRQVLYINASHLQSFQHLLENSAPITDPAVYSSLAAPTGQVYNEIRHVLKQEGFYYLPAFKASLISLGLQYSVFEKIALSAKETGHFDYIVVDADGVLTKDTARLMGIADRVLIVTEQTRHSVFATNTLIRNTQQQDEGKYFVICSNYKKNQYNALTDPAISLEFFPAEYTEHHVHYEQMGPVDFAAEQGIGRIAFLLL